MKHKLLPTMIGAVLAAGMGAAQADITVFGHLDTSVNSWEDDFKADDGAGTITKGSEDDLNFQCTTCSIGFKGSEDLGNGLKAIFKLDFQFDMFDRQKGDESRSLTDRDQWLGLAGNFGQLRWGTISTGYKSHGAMIDPLYRTSVQGRDIGLQSALHSGAGEEGQGRAEYTLRWDSPDWNGVKVTAHYTLDSDESGKTEDNNPFGIGAQYKNGGMLVFVDYLTNDGDGKSTTNYDQNELTAWKVGGKYTMNNFGLYAQYEDITDDFSDGSSFAPDYSDLTGGFAADVEGNIWHVAGSYTMGNNMVYLGYGQGDFDASEVGFPYKINVEYDALSLVGVHSLSKRTSAYAGYAMNELDAKSTDSEKLTNEYDVFTVGMKHKF